MKLASYGKREWLGGGIIAACIAVAGLAVSLATGSVMGWILALLAGVLWASLAAFFRVPNRNIPQESDTLLSPADGVVADIGVLPDHGIEPFLGQPLVCIGIFLSVFDVHVNRAPADMKVTHRQYKPGRYLDARNPRCAKENESLTIVGTATIEGENLPVAIRQISGAIARRIVCDPQPGDQLARGEIYGMIKFGSRTELYFPDNAPIKPAVSIGSKVRSGTTVVAKTEH